LGLAEWRLGHLEAAREAFERGGQPAMVTRMEEALAGAASASPAELPPELAAAEPEAQPEPSARPAPPAPGQRAEGATERSSADEAPRTPITHRLFSVPPVVRRPRREGGVFARPTAEDEAAHVATTAQATAAQATAAPAGTARASEAPAVPSRNAAAAHTAVTSPGAYAAPGSKGPAPVAAAVPLDALVAGALVAPPPGATFGVAPTGELVVQSTGPTWLRYAPLSALAGELRIEPLPRAPGTPGGDAPLGGEDAVMRWAGPLYALFDVLPERRFQVLDLAGATLYLRETALFGFGEGVRHESATLPLDEEPVDVVKLSGEGPVVLQLASALFALPVSAGEPLMVQPDRVLGWSGRLFPAPRRGTAPYGATAPRLAFRGEGAVLVGAPSESK
ncbi:MAG: hypothetical protein AAF447_24965, partial [Myxococcota bacterium]